MTRMDDEKIAIAKMGVGASGAVLYSYTLNEWVAIVTLLYLVLQIGLLMPKYYEALSAYLRNRK
ncbi:hypothetical protein [Dyadobacter bucti]|uniref:hypothetical protein n=1 Tax=Dyadobacter bucti TaxID=2572203 RepID=UPI0011099D81|nr:hypothetical protein [Dyadobacter bucti]